MNADPDLRSNFRDFSDDFHLLPMPDAYSRKIERPKISRKPVPSTSSYDTYSAVGTDEEPFKHEAKHMSKSWPGGPGVVNQWTTTRYWILLCDLLITLLPLIFLVLAICAMALDKQPLSPFGAHIVSGSKLGPTLFPVIFAALVGRLMRAVALWKAEKGTKLGLLEQLVGSQTLASTLERMVLLQRYGPVGFGILSLWLLSPLGGQSSLRILDVVPALVTSKATLQYFDVNMTDNNQFSGADYMETGGPSVSALFQASLLASQQVKNSPVDSWNNVKIPMLDELSPFAEQSSTGTWILVNKTADWTYASLSGLNVNGLSQTGSSTFNLETSYVQLSCGDGKSYERDNSTGLDGGYGYVFPGGLQCHNTSFPFGSESYFLDTSYPSSFNGNHTAPINLMYASQLAMETDSMTLYNCSVMTSRVEANIQCTGPSCAANALRRSLVDTRDPLVVPFIGSAYENMLIFFSSATGVGHEAITDPIDFYMLGYDQPYSPTTTDETLRNYTNVTGAYLERRLSTLVNTLWQASVAPNSIPIGSAATPTDNETLVLESFEQPVYFANSTAATITKTVDVYHAPRLWTTILLITSLMLQLCGIAGLVLKYITTAPDILGYVSAMTRDNPYVDVLPGGNTLDGLERAKYLKDMNVLISDVKWEDDVGHIAFHGVHQSDEWVGGRVRKRRLYL